MRLLDEWRQGHQQVGLWVGLLLLDARDHLAGPGLDDVDVDAGVLGELVELALVPGGETVGAVDGQGFTATRARRAGAAAGGQRDGERCDGSRRHRLLENRR